MNTSIVSLRLRSLVRLAAFAVCVSSFLPHYAISAPTSGQEVGVSIEQFTGLNDAVPAIQIADNQAQDLLNVDVDYGILKKRDGFGSISAPGVSGRVSGLFPYANSSGDTKLLVCYSTAIALGTGTTTWTVLTSTMTADKYYDAAQAQDIMFLTNGTDAIRQFDGTNITVNTTIPKGNFIEHHDNRLWVATSSAVYHSEALDYDLFDIIASTGAAGQINVRPSDGQNVRGMKSWAGRLIIWKDDSTFEITGSGPPNDIYAIRLVSDEYGCISNWGAQEYKGVLFWPSKKGIVAYDGGSIQLISSKITNYWKGVTLNENTYITVTDNDSTDFGLGTHSDTEYNATLSGVVLDQDKVIDSFADNDYTNSPTWTVSGTWSAVTGTLINSMSGTSASGAGGASIDISNAYGTWEFYASMSGDSNGKGWRQKVYIVNDGSNNGYMVKLSGTDHYSIILYRTSSNGSSESPLINAMGLSIITSATVKVTRSADGEFELFIDGTSYGTATDTTYSSSTKFSMVTSPAVLPFSGGVDLGIDNIKMTALSGTFTGRSIDTSVTTPSFSRFEAINTSVETSTVTYYTQSSADGTTWDTRILISNSDMITSTPKRYIRYQAVFASTSGQTEALTLGSIQYSASIPATMPSVVIDDKYYLGVKLLGSSANDRVIVYSPDWGFTLYDWPVNYFTMYKNVLYHGKSGTYGIYDHSGQSNDAGVAINAYWKSRDFAFGTPFITKTFDRGYVMTKGESNAYDMDLTFNISEAVETNAFTRIVSLNSTNPFMKSRFNLPLNAYGNLLSIKLSNDDSGETFHVYGLGLYGKTLTIP